MPAKKSLPDILPCPFCGNKDLYLGHDQFCVMSVACGTCSAKVTYDYSQETTVTLPKARHEFLLKERVIKMWNRREDSDG